MSQVERNKAELFGGMEQLAHEPMSVHNIRSLDTLMGAYKVLCPVSGAKHRGPERVRKAGRSFPGFSLCLLVKINNTCIL